jgi:hypothetical protein
MATVCDLQIALSIRYYVIPFKVVKLAPLPVPECERKRRSGSATMLNIERCIQELVLVIRIHSLFHLRMASTLDTLLYTKRSRSRLEGGLLPAYPTSNRKPQMTSRS